MECKIHLSAQKGLNEACISSSVRPLVSGTNLATNRTVMPHTPQNSKNVPEQDGKKLGI